MPCSLRALASLCSLVHSLHTTWTNSFTTTPFFLPSPGTIFGAIPIPINSTFSIQESSCRSVHFTTQVVSLPCTTTLSTFSGADQCLHVRSVLCFSALALSLLHAHSDSHSSTPHSGCFSGSPTPFSMWWIRAP